MSETEKSDYIKSKCGLKDVMYEIVTVIEKKERRMPTVKCNKCEKPMTGGPAKFRAHNNPAENGAETCIKLDRDYQRKAEAHLEAELEKKRKAELERKRKTLVAVAQAKTDARKKQLKLDQMGMDDLSEAGLHALWAKVVFAAPVSENPFFVKAVEATSRFALSHADKQRAVTDPDSVPKYKAGSNLRLKKKLLAMMRSWTPEAAESDDEEEENEKEKEKEGGGAGAGEAIMMAE